jgi:hypothetical protein
LVSEEVDEKLCGLLASTLMCEIRSDPAGYVDYAAVNIAGFVKVVDVFVRRGEFFFTLY